MQMCKWHWECCEALPGSTTPLGRPSGRPQLSSIYRRTPDSALVGPCMLRSRHISHMHSHACASAHHALAGRGRCVQTSSEASLPLQGCTGRLMHVGTYVYVPRLCKATLAIWLWGALSQSYLEAIYSSRVK